MRKDSLETFIIGIYRAYFTESSARQAAQEDLSRKDIYLLAAYMKTHATLLNGNKDNYFTNTISYLNERYGDYHAYLLFEKLRDPKAIVFTDEKDPLSQLNGLIEESHAPAPLKNVLLNRLQPPNDFGQERQNYINFIEKYKRFDCYILANKCAEQGKVLDPARLKYLAQHLQDISHVSENFYEFIAGEIVTNGVSHTLAHFDELKARFDEQNQVSDQSLAELDDADTAEINPAEAETDDDVVFITPPAPEPTEAPPPPLPKTRPVWARAEPTQNAKLKEPAATAPESQSTSVKKAAPTQRAIQKGPSVTATAAQSASVKKDTLPLPYLHDAIDLADLDNEKKLLPKKGHKLQVGKDMFTLYGKGKLGEGTFGTVWLAQNDNTGEWIAIKQLKFIPPREHIQPEIDNLKATKNFEFEHEEVNGNFYIGMKLGKGMSLENLLEKSQAHTNPARLSEAQRLLIAKQMLKSTVDIHYDTKTMIATTDDRGVDKDKRKAMETRLLHRDIKPANMMIDSALKTEHIDLGLAGKVTRDQSKIREGAMGSPFFMSPEIYKPNEEVDVTFSESSDVYAVGVSMLEVFDIGIKNQPRIDTTKAAHHDPALIALIASMLNKNPSKRPSAAAAYTQLDKIIRNYNANNPTNPVGLKAYAVNIEDFAQAKLHGRTDAFVRDIAKRGINSIAFYSPNPNVDSSLLIEAQRAFSKAGIAHILPNLFCNNDERVNLDIIQASYNRLFGSQATIIHTKDAPGIEIRPDNQWWDIKLVLDNYINNKGDIHFKMKLEDARKIPDRKEALIYLIENFIEQVEGEKGKPFFDNAGKKLLNDILAIQGMPDVLAENHSNSSADRATRLKAAILPKIPPIGRGSIVKQIDMKVEQALQEKKSSSGATRSH